MNSPILQIFLELFSPPALNFLFLIMGALLFKKARVTSKLLISVSLISLLLLSFSPISLYLARQVENIPAINTDKIRQLQKDGDSNRAIVVIGGGRQTKAFEYEEIDTLNSVSLERVRYAAWLQKKLDIPVLLSGGSPNNEATSEAVLMNQVMMSSFNIAPRWIESNSRNLIENAQFSSLILKKANLEEIILVTHASQMPLAIEAFKDNDIKIIPAPIGFSAQSSFNDTILPNAKALATSSEALKGIYTLYWIRFFG